MSAETARAAQQPCIHCGECARACPVALDPATLFFALVEEDWPAVQRGGVDACTECRRCVEVCPSHIPLLDWFRWGKSELRAQSFARQRADAARARFLARNARLQREREARAAPRVPGHDGESAAGKDNTGETPPVRTLGKADVLAAIARGRMKKSGLRKP